LGPSAAEQKARRQIVLKTPAPPGYTRAYTSSSGGFVDVHERHGAGELAENLRVAKPLADRGERVRLLPIERQIRGRKNPDASRAGVVWEFKETSKTTYSAYDNHLRRGAEQARRLVLRLAGAAPNLTNLENVLHSRTRQAKNLLRVDVMWRNHLVSFTRPELLSNTFRGKLSRAFGFKKT